MQTANRVTSEEITLQQITQENYFFNIPIYQRLYVWGKDQVEALLSDLWEACEQGKDVFYLGTALVIENKGQPEKASPENHYFDLIDGQQRLTTLWLISLAWKEKDGGELEKFRYTQFGDQKQHRIKFAIRPKIATFFENIIEGKDARLPEAKQLEDAMATIENFASKQQVNSKFDIPKLANFILNKVQFVFSQVPQNADLNKIFELINNRGVQLQHHEILKAKLLKEIGTAEEREHYGQLWDACSHMGDYVERNLKHTTKINLTDIISDGRPVSAEAVIGKLKDFHNSKTDEDKRTLMDILKSDPPETSHKESSSENDQDDYETGKVRSIITFPMLLQHTLRIWLVKKNRDDIERIQDKDLIAIFENSWLNPPKKESEPEAKAESKQEEAKSFIELLWDTRFQFDNHIIKWVKDGDEDVHAIKPLKYNEGRLSREMTASETSRSFTLLQSMLYHSQPTTTQYWLTPLLKHLLDKKGKEPLSYLQYLDNQLFCCDREDTLLQKTYEHMKEGYSTYHKESADILDKPLGVSFPHYWFYKLEYILWSQGKNDAWKSFRITARNSVEHISPQNPEAHDDNTVSEEQLNSFGNLALVSRSLNSEYSNKPFREKRERFLGKNRQRVDSLKMDLIYRNEKWNDTLARCHQEDMKKTFEDYFKSVNDAAYKPLRLE